jgi:hypothetical protein
MMRAVPWAVASALAFWAPSAGAQERGRAATVSLLEGSAQVRRGPGAPQDLRQGSSVRQGDVVETGDDSRLELKLPDASALRIGPRARVALTAVDRGRAGAQLSVKVFSGNVWASAAGRDRGFQIETQNAVASARGTTFRVDAHEDRSVLVRAYSGAVSVERKPAWEKRVGKQMQILISADGTPGIPTPFSEADEKDDGWAAWNRKRDGQGK